MSFVSSGLQNELKDSLALLAALSVVVDASSGLQSEFQDPPTGMVSDVVNDDSTCLHNELKDSLPIVMKQDTAQNVSRPEVVMEASLRLQSELRDSVAGCSSQVDSVPCG